MKYNELESLVTEATQRILSEGPLWKQIPVVKGGKPTELTFLQAYGATGAQVSKLMIRIDQFNSEIDKLDDKIDAIEAEVEAKYKLSTIKKSRKDREEEKRDDIDTIKDLLVDAVGPLNELKSAVYIGTTGSNEIVARLDKASKTTPRKPNVDTLLKLLNAQFDPAIIAKLVEQAIDLDTTIKNKYNSNAPLPKGNELQHESINESIFSDLIRYVKRITLRITGIKLTMQSNNKRLDKYLTDLISDVFIFLKLYGPLR